VDNNHDGVCDNFQTRMKNGHGEISLIKTGMAYVIILRLPAMEEENLVIVAGAISIVMDVHRNVFAEVDMVTATGNVSEFTDY